LLIVHGSDLQAGRPYRPQAAEAFVQAARDLRPDLVVVSGDLTQRAKVGEYRTVRALLERLEGLPVVVTPGNHDVPLYRVWERLLTPYRNWRRFISPELDSVTELPGATVVALHTSAPRRAIVAGRLDSAQVAFARRAFAATPPGRLRLLVAHHHFIPTSDGRGGRPIPGAAAHLADFEAAGVDLVLGGHVHFTRIETSRALVPGSGPGVPIVSCGTTASSRGRAPETGKNSFNVVRVGPDTLEVVSWTSEAEGAPFVPAPPRVLPRVVRAPGALSLPGGAA